MRRYILFDNDLLVDRDWEMIGFEVKKMKRKYTKKVYVIL